MVIDDLEGPPPPKRSKVAAEDDPFDSRMTKGEIRNLINKYKRTLGDGVQNQMQWDKGGGNIHFTTAMPAQNFWFVFKPALTETMKNQILTAIENRTTSNLSFNFPVAGDTATATVGAKCMKKGGRYSTMIVTSLNVSYNAGSLTLSGWYSGGGGGGGGGRRRGWFGRGFFGF